MSEEMSQEIAMDRNTEGPTSKDHKVGEVSHGILNDHVEFTWEPDNTAEEYAIVLQLIHKDDKQIDRQIKNNSCSFTFAEVRVGCSYDVSVCRLLLGKKDKLLAQGHCFIGGPSSVRNVSAIRNPMNGVRMIDVSFEKPALPHVSAYKVSAVPAVGSVTREQETKVTKVTMKYLKSGTKYTIYVRAIYDDAVEDNEIPECNSPPVRTSQRDVLGRSIVKTSAKSTKTAAFLNMAGVSEGKVDMQGSQIDFKPIFATVNNMRPTHIASEVRGLEVYAVGDKIQAQWDPPLFSGNSDDYKIEYFRLEIFKVRGPKVESIVVPYHENIESFVTHQIDVELGTKYKLTVKTRYEDIDAEKTHFSDHREFEVITEGEQVVAEGGPGGRDAVDEFAQLDGTFGEENVMTGRSKKTKKGVDEWALDDNWEKRQEISTNLRFVEAYSVTNRKSGTERLALKMNISRLSEKDNEELTKDLKTFTRMSHRHLVRCFCYDKIDRNIYIITELIQWSSLEKKIDGKPLNQELASRLTYQILNGLSYLHENDIIHGNIQSQNILLSDHENIKINGYILGQKVAEAFSRSSWSVSALTLKGEKFLSPEEMCGASTSTKIDIWGLGCTVLEMVTGQEPWHDYTLKRVRNFLEEGAVPLVQFHTNSRLKNFLALIFVDEKRRPVATSLMTHSWVSSPSGTQSDSCSQGVKTEEFRAKKPRLDVLDTNPHYKCEDFEMGKELGGGAYGIVDVGKHKVTGIEYAIKKLHPREKGDMRPTNSFIKREVDLSEALKHKNLVECHGHYIMQEKNKFPRFCLVLELMKESLGAKIRREHGLKEPVAKCFTGQIISGLQYIHKNGFVHRDIKGDNILVGFSDQEVKIADYGFVKKIRDSLLHECTLSTTKHGGTIYWKSPEIAMDVNYNQNTDIWSLGCAVVEMIEMKAPLAYLPNAFKVLSEWEDSGVKDTRRITILKDENVSVELRAFLTKIFVDKKIRPYAHQLSAANPW